MRLAERHMAMNDQQIVLSALLKRREEIVCGGVEVPPSEFAALQSSIRELVRLLSPSYLVLSEPGQGKSSVRVRQALHRYRPEGTVEVRKGDLK